MAPAMGALNIVPMPAPMATATASLLSSGLSLRSEKIPDEIPAEMKASDASYCREKRAEARPWGTAQGSSLSWRNGYVNAGCPDKQEVLYGPYEKVKGDGAEPRDGAYDDPKERPLFQEGEGALGRTFHL
jgi:hypothetical protein